MQDSIDGLKHAKEVLDESIKNSQPVKDGKITAEEVQENPAYTLYNDITETTISILNDEKVRERFNIIASAIGGASTQALIELISIVMTHSAYQAIVNYDKNLWEIIGKQFEVFGNQQNMLKSSIDAHESVLRVFKEKINKLETNETIDKFTKENNISE